MDSEENPIKITLKVARSDKDARNVFQVEAAGGHVRVLDLLLNARAEQDPTLSFRCSCRVGMCGSCAMIINGRERLACGATVEEMGDEIDVRPLRALPVKRDLLVDMKPFFDKIRKFEAVMMPADPEHRAVKQLPGGRNSRAEVELQNGCISCGACYSACQWTESRPEYAGPAVMNRIFMLASDEKDSKKTQRLEGIATDDGILRCHLVGDCAEVCPVDIPILTGLQRLRGMVTKGG